MEAYTPEQLKYRTGGPGKVDLLMEPADLRRELAGLRFEMLEERLRYMREGALHEGTAAVVQVVGVKAEK